MADRYWVGGTGSWSSTNTANWSAATGKSITASCATTTLTVTAGTVVVGDTVWSNNHTSLGTITADLGGGNWTVSVGGTFASQAMSAATVGASVPTASDSVFFDANSNSGTTAFTVTMANTPRLCNNFTAFGLDGTMTLAGTSIGLTVSGSLEFPATNFTRTYTGTTTFNATTTGKTITTNGVALASVTLNGVGGAWTLGSALNCSGFTVTAGTFSTSVSNYSITASSITSSGTTSRTISLNGSIVNLNSTGPVSLVSTNLTFNAGTSSINLTSSGSSNFVGAGVTFNDVTFTSTASTSGIRTISGANTFNNLTIATLAAVGSNTYYIGAGQTINGTLTVTGANGNRRQFIRSDVTGTTRTLTCAAIATMDDVDFRDIAIAGAASPLSGTRLGNCGGNSNITFDAPKTVYWNLAAGGNWSATAWATGSGGTPADTNFPLAQDTAIIENPGLNTSASITIDAQYNIGTLDSSTRTQFASIGSGGLLTFIVFNGDLILGTGITSFGGASTVEFSNRSIKTLTTNNRSFGRPVTIDAPGGGIQLVTNNLTVTSANTFTLLQGTLDLNSLTLTTGLFDSSNANTRTIAFGTTGSIVANTTTSGVTVLSMATATNFTFTGTSNISAAMSVTRTFNFGGTAGATTSNRLNINLTSGASIPTFTGSFRQINFTGSTSNPGNQNIFCHGFTLASGGTYTTTDFTTVGDGTLTYTGKAFDALSISGSGITTTLADAGQNGQLSLINGTLDLAGFTFTATSAVVTFTGTKNLTFNGGTVVCSAATSTAWYNNVPTGFTTTAGTGTGTISMTAATAKTFVGGGSTYNCTLNQGGAGTLTITGANTFNDIAETVPTANQITFPASTTTTVNAFTLSGSSGNLVSIRSSTPGTRFTLSDASGTVNVSFLDIQDSNATGGATWNAFTTNGNVNSGNNLGWVFAAPPTGGGGNFFLLFA